MRGMIEAMEHFDAIPPVLPIAPMDPYQIDDSWYERGECARERTSAGGVVVRIEGGNLFVALIREIDCDGLELDGYVLPKGGVEPGESVEEAALREVREEAGLSEVTWLSNLTVVEHLDRKKEYWATCHYALFYTKQLEGEILDKAHHFGFGWFPIESPPRMYWPCERALLRKQRNLIYDLVIQHQNPKGRKKGFM